MHLSCASYEGETSPKWVRGVKDTPWLDVSATLGEDGYVNVAVVNIHEEKDIRSSIDGPSGTVSVFTVTGERVQACNMNGKEEVAVTESTWEAREQFVFPKHSLTLLRWKLE